MIIILFVLHLNFAVAFLCISFRFIITNVSRILFLLFNVCRFLQWLNTSIRYIGFFGSTVPTYRQFISTFIPLPLTVSTNLSTSVVCLFLYMVSTTSRPSCPFDLCAGPNDISPLYNFHHSSARPQLTNSFSRIYNFLDDGENQHSHTHADARQMLCNRYEFFTLY